MNLKYMKVSLFEITYKKKLTFSRHSNLLRCTCIYIHTVYTPTYLHIYIYTYIYTYEYIHTVSHKSEYTPNISAINLVYLFKGQYYRNETWIYFRVDNVQLV